jgi:hypothetical protein
LQYIKIGSFAWQFIVQYDTDLPETSYSSVRIRELQQDEILSFELFGIDDFPTLSGLPGPEDRCEEFSEEEWDRTEQMSKEFDEAQARGNLEEVAERWAAEARERTATRNATAQAPSDILSETNI